MARTVHCVVLKREAEALDKPPHPGEIGQRIFAHVSKEGWSQWLERLTTIINEDGMSTMEYSNFAIIEKHMTGFFFGEGEYGQLPEGFRPAESDKKP